MILFTLYSFALLLAAAYGLYNLWPEFDVIVNGAVNADLTKGLKVILFLVHFMLAIDLLKYCLAYS